MSEKTLIAWTDHTFNAWMGCTKVSAGCANCYAESLTKNRMGLSLWGPDAAPTGLPSRPGSTFALGEGRRGRRTRHVGPWPAAPRFSRLVDGLGRRSRGPRRTAQRTMGGDPQLSAPAFPDAHQTAREHRRLFARGLGQWVFQCLAGYVDRGHARRRAGRSSARRFRPLSASSATSRRLGPLDELDLTGLDWIIFGGESGPG